MVSSILRAFPYSYVESNINEKITVADLAEISGYEKNYFSRVFERIINDTPSSYIKKRKISSAKNLLITSTDSITEIARKLGFESVQHFSKVFRAMEGVCPTEYRKRITSLEGVNLSEDVDLPKKGRHAYAIRKWFRNESRMI
ncbi:MAG: helix-turn-helix transcriptional regulator [Lachnospiraceae bacterium]|nr:helix-turn-helix transcriptional regulator [Lachnospiraceae bacterium]